MTVSELIRALRQMPAHAKVVTEGCDCDCDDIGVELQGYEQTRPCRNGFIEYDHTGMAVAHHRGCSECFGQGTITVHIGSPNEVLLTRR